MKIRVIILQFLMVMLYRPASPQEFEVSASKPDVNNGTTHLHKIIGHDKDHYYVIKFYGTQYFLEKLDNELNPVIEEPIKLFRGIKTYQLETVVHFHNELYVFVSRARIDDITLYYLRISKDNLQPVSELTEVAKIKNIKGAWADFHFALSRHETKLMVACRTKLSWSGAQFNEIFVFDKGLEVVWKRKDSFEFAGPGPRDNMYIVDETGNVSVLSLLKREWLISLVRKIKNLYNIYSYTHNGEMFKEYPVTITDRFIRGVRIIAGDQGELICTGLYSDLLRKGVRGSFFFRIDPITGNVVDYNLNEFDDAFISQLSKMKEPLIAQEELISYVITDVVLRENNKIIMIAEQVFNQPYDTYNNLIITCFDNNGQVYWTQVVEKHQDFHFRPDTARYVELSDYRDYIMNTGFLEQGAVNYCSYALMAPLDKSAIIIFYNDNIRNLEQPGEKGNFRRPKKSYILAVTIDEYGNISRNPLVPWKKKASFPEPIRFYDTLHETIVIPAFRYRRFNYYKITAHLP